MKRLRGDLVIELEDRNTGVVERVAESNMVTNAVNHILGINPMGALYNAGGEFDEMVDWNEEMLPICPNMIGGILLFPGAVTEDEENIFLSSGNMPVGYASNNVNSTANVKRGSLNLSESMPLTDGYKFVWEFTPSQGNGTISAVGLTSKQGGMNGYGSDVEVDTTLLQLRKISVGNAGGAIGDLLRAVSMDFERGRVFALSFDTSTVTVREYRIPTFDIGLNERLDDRTLTLVESTGILCSTFEFLGSDSEYGIFMDGGDGYWYGFANQGNSSGNATVLWVKIRQSDCSFTEGRWTISNAALMPVGSFMDDMSYPEGSRNAVMRGGYLYVPAYDKRGVYKINVANITDVTLIPLGFMSGFESIGDSGSMDVCMTLIGDLIVAYDFEIDVNDNVIRTYAGIRCGEIATPFFQYKEFLVAWGGAFASNYRYTFLLTPYLATICNLAQPVVKNVDKTMKITYTLTEVEGSGSAGAGAGSGGSGGSGS